MFEFLKSFRICLFHLVREPESLGEIEADNTDHHDHEQHLSNPLEVADQTHHSAAKKETRPCQHEDPQKATCKGECQKTQVRHSPHAIKHTRGPAQSINVL